MLAWIGSFWNRPPSSRVWHSTSKLEKYCARVLKRNGWRVRLTYWDPDVSILADRDGMVISVACKRPGQLYSFNLSALATFARQYTAVSVVILLEPAARQLQNEAADAGVYLVPIDQLPNLRTILAAPAECLRPVPQAPEATHNAWATLRG